MKKPVGCSSSPRTPHLLGSSLVWPCCEGPGSRSWMRQKVAELIPHLLWITIFGTISLCFLVKWGLAPMSRVCSLVAEPNWAVSKQTKKCICLSLFVYSRTHTYTLSLSLSLTHVLTHSQENYFTAQKPPGFLDCSNKLT